MLPSFPGPPRFCSSVSVQYNTWKQSKKQGRPWNTYHMTWMWGGCRGVVPNYNYTQVFYQSSRVLRSCERMGSCLAIEGSMMKSSMLFECGPFSIYVHPPNVIHVISVPSPSPFFSSLPLLCIVLYWTQTEGRECRRPGNGATIGWQAYIHSGWMFFASCFLDQLLAA